MTDAEIAMWLQLRGRRLHGFKFKRQWTLGPFVVDFCCSEAKLVVEIDGGQHSEDRDRRRTEWLIEEGYRVRRFWNNDVWENMDGVLRVLTADLAGTDMSDPHPNPLPQAGEGAS